MNPFNQAWVILKESEFSKAYNPEIPDVYENIDGDFNLSRAYTSRLYTECEECGWLHNNPICDYCEAVHDEYIPNPQYEKTRLGNKEFASEKELLEYLEANPPQKYTNPLLINKPNSQSHQLKLTNFGDIDEELGPALVNTNTLSEYLGEEPVMYTHVTDRGRIPSIMTRGLDPELADTRNQGVWEAEQAKLRKPESAPIYSTNRKHDYHEYSGLLPAIHDMMPEEVRELYDSPTNLTPEEQREAIINAMKPAVFLTQPDKTALRVMAGLMRENNPKVVGVRGMLPPNKLGERNIDETHDAGLPEKISLDTIPPEQLVFYNQNLTPSLGYGMSRKLGEPLSVAEDSPVMNMIADYRNLYEQGVVPQPGYFPTQEDYDRYQANRQ